MSRIPAPRRTERTFERKVTPLANSTTISQAGPSSTIRAESRHPIGQGKQIGTVGPSQDSAPQQKASLLQKRIFKQALSKSAQEPGKKVHSVGVTRSRIAPPKVITKRGEEDVLQQMEYEAVVQRTPRAEYIAKTVTGINVEPTGAHKLQFTAHQIDPTHGTESAGINETTSYTDSLTTTAGGKLRKISTKKKTLIAQKLKDKPNLNPHHVNRLVKEETEDVENTLRVVPPDLVSSSVQKFPLKKKLQRLRLNAEPVSLLTQSVIHPPPTADEVDVEAPPEVVASVIDAVEKGVTPEVAPNQIFNSLFPQIEEPRILVSSVAPGPLEDIVVPTERGPSVLEEGLTDEMETFLANQIAKKQELPKDDICVQNNIKAVERTSKATNKAPMLLEIEKPPWESMAVEKLSNLVGGDPIEFLDISDISAIESPEALNDELSKGIDYFIDADVVPYETKIQIRGSKIPAWFPGYMSAFSHLPELVKISRTPSQVLTAAWKAVQPKIFPEDSLLIV